MTFDDIKEMQIGSKKVKEAWLNGRQVYPSEKRIMDSLVCWYDIGKQQCTNESMASNPVLADLSGNGHDITCYNFGWAGMSGIGGYVTDFTNAWSVYSNAQYTKSQTTINITHIAPSNEDFIIGWLSEYITNSVTSGTEFSLPPVRFKVTGISDLQLTAQVRGDEQAYTQDISEGVEYYFPGGNFTCDRNTNVGFAIKYKSGTQPVGQEIDLNLVVEILPEYSNALVSDGVDDYCYTDGLPILTDYTVIAKRKWLSTEIPNNHINLACKGITKGAFIFERLEKSSNVDITYSFGHINVIDTQANDITYQTSTSYNGINIKKGENIDVDDLILCSRYTTSGFAQIALYSFLLFDRTLTTAEIEWVKKNMIESGGVLATNWADSSIWGFYNEANQSRITGTLSSNRMTISSSGMINPGIPVTSNFMECIVQFSMIPAYKIKVSGLKNGIILYYADNPIRLEMSEDGIYNIPEHNTQNRYFGFSFKKAFKNENIVIQQLLSE